MNKSYVLFSVFPLLLLTVWQSHDEVVVPDDSKSVVSTIAVKKPVTAEQADLYELSNYLEDGQRTRRQMSEEWSSWVGDSQPLRWVDLKFDKPHRLSMVLTEIQNNADSPYQMIHIHSIGFDGEQDDTVTLYNRPIDGIEEKNIKADIVVSQKIERKDDQFVLSEAHRNSYRLALDKQNFKRVYDERSPQVAYDFHELHEMDFDVVKAVLEGSGLSEGGLYDRELSWNGKTYVVQMNLRQTSVETTSIEVQFHEVDSLNTQKFALIYEAI